MTPRPLYLLGVWVALLASCTSSKSLVVAKVGDYEVTEAMADYREKVAKLYYPKETAKVGLAQLIRSFKYAQILKNNGRPITDADLANEDRRIDEHTRDPDLLSKIKAAFGSDHEAYLKVFVLPNFAERTIYYDFFLGSPKIQAEFKGKAESFFDAASRNPAAFLSLAHDRGLSPQKLVLHPKKGLEWAPLDESPKKKAAQTTVIDKSPKSKQQLTLEDQLSEEKLKQDRETARLWMKDVVGHTAKGAVFDSLVDMHENWVVVRYLGPASGKPDQLFHAVSFPKADYSAWMSVEQGKVSVQLSGPR